MKRVRLTASLCGCDVIFERVTTKSRRARRGLWACSFVAFEPWWSICLCSARAAARYFARLVLGSFHSCSMHRVMHMRSFFEGRFSSCFSDLNHCCKSTCDYASVCRVLCILCSDTLFQGGWWGDWFSQGTIAVSLQRVWKRVILYNSTLYVKR